MQAPPAWERACPAITGKAGAMHHIAGQARSHAAPAKSKNFGMFHKGVTADKATCHHLDYTPCTAAVLPGHRPAKECPWFPVPLCANAARSA
ncbi:hypothetical protein PRtIB026_A51360 [Pseudomonas sp. RtIB026]|nr:hypothetical protein PRtIB026_A51360 [Pseudomonas sp. RtIB026]